MPSIRRDIRTRAKTTGDRAPQQPQPGDPENPPQNEEVVPLNSMGQGSGAADTGREAVGGESGAYGAQQRLPSTHGCIKEEDEEDDEKLRSNNEFSRGERILNEERDFLYPAIKDGADSNRGDDRGGGRGGGFDNVDIGKTILFSYIAMLKFSFRMRDFNLQCGVSTFQRFEYNSFQFF